MLSFNFARWIRSMFRPQPRTYAKRMHVLFQLETLEAREAPATHIWTGLGSNALWSNVNNWKDSSLPTANSLDDLVFDSRAPLASRTMFNDIVGLQINSIQIDAQNYVFGGTEFITLGSPTVASSGSITVGANGLGADFQINLQLAGPNGSNQLFDIQSGDTITPGLKISGRISGATGSELTKTGIGTLTLSNDNSGFSGPFTIANDAGVVNITHANALGAGSASEVQKIDLSGATNGKFNLRFNGSLPTANLDFSATALDVQNALNALSTIAPSTVSVIRSGNALFITFGGGSLDGTNVAQLVATGVSGTIATPSTLTQGGAFAGTTLGQNSQIQLTKSSAEPSSNRSCSMAPASAKTGQFATWRETMSGAATSSSVEPTPPCTSARKPEHRSK